MSRSLRHTKVSLDCICIVASQAGKNTKEIAVSAVKKSQQARSLPRFSVKSNRLLMQFSITFEV